MQINYKKFQILWWCVPKSKIRYYEELKAYWGEWRSNPPEWSEEREEEGRKTAKMLEEWFASQR